METLYLLVYKIMFAKDINGNFLNEWTVNVDKLLHELVFVYMWNHDSISVNHVNMIIQIIYVLSLLTKIEFRIGLVS